MLKEHNTNHALINTFVSQFIIFYADRNLLPGFVICLTKHYLIDPYILKSKYQFIKLILRFVFLPTDKKHSSPSAQSISFFCYLLCFFILLSFKIYYTYTLPLHYNGFLFGFPACLGYFFFKGPFLEKAANTL